MNRRLAASLYHVFWWTGISRLARALLVRRGRFVLLFHGVASRKYRAVTAAAQPWVDAREMRRILQWLGDRFRFLTAEEFFESEAGGVLLTFDDGFANNYRVALPLLEEHSAPAIFFVATQHILEPRNWLPATRLQAGNQWQRPEEVTPEIAEDLYDGMSEEELRSCAGHPLLTIGSHTVSHPFLTRCDDSTLESELDRSKAYLESVVGAGVDLFAYPTGDYDRRVAEAVRRSGYRHAFVMDSRGAGLPAFEIPRVGIYSQSPAYLAAKLSGLHRRSLHCVTAGR